MPRRLAASLLEEIELKQQTQPEKDHPHPGDLAVGRADLGMPVPIQRPAAGDIARKGHDGPAHKDADQAEKDGQSPQR